MVWPSWGASAASLNRCAGRTYRSLGEEHVVKLTWAVCCRGVGESRRGVVAKQQCFACFLYPGAEAQRQVEGEGVRSGLKLFAIGMPPPSPAGGERNRSANCHQTCGLSSRSSVGSCVVMIPRPKSTRDRRCLRKSSRSLKPVLQNFEATRRQPVKDVAVCDENDCHIEHLLCLHRNRFGL